MSKNGKSFEPSERQLELLAFVAGFMTEHGFSPSLREIVDATSFLSTSTVSYHVAVLQEEGYVAHRPHMARTLRVIKAFEEPGVGP